ncbi:hypothetical protein Tco_0512286 [Tanacetum coccineum]
MEGRTVPKDRPCNYCYRSYKDGKLGTRSHDPAITRGIYPGTIHLNHKLKAATWFKPIQEDERPATPEPEWTIPPNDFSEPENNLANAYATSYQVPAENKLQRKTYDIGSFIKWFCRRTGKKKLCKANLEGPTFNLVKAFHKNNVFLQFQMDECHKLLTNKVDLVNPEGHQILRNIYEPLPLGGPPGDKERKIALSISRLKDARYLDFGLEELVRSLWVESDGTLTRVMEKLDHMVKYFHLFEYNKGMETRNGQRMTREGAKTSSQRSRKDYRSGGSFKVWKALLEEE